MKITEIIGHAKQKWLKVKEWYSKLTPKKQVLVLIGAGFLLFIIVWGIFDQPPRQRKEADHTMSQSEVWTCPMHPEVQMSKPGQCPICGMNLVKKVIKPQPSTTEQHTRSAQPKGHERVFLTSEEVQKIGVKIGMVEVKPLIKVVDAVGRVAFDPELYTAQKEFLESLQHWQSVKNAPLEDVRQSAQQMVESSKLRLKILGLSDEQIKTLEQTGQAGGSLLLPKPGEDAWVYAEVFEMDLPDIQPGLKAKISGWSLEGTTLEGSVVSVDRVINPTTRTAKARIQIEKVPTQLWPEAYFDVSILVPLGTKVVIPSDAVLETGKESWVFVADGSGGFEPRMVKIGVRAGEEVSITEGLTGGEAIVTSANFLIDSESRLRGAIESMKKEETKKPECPPGKEWHDAMQMCM